MSDRPLFRIDAIVWRTWRWTRVEFRSMRKKKIHHSTPTFLLYLRCFASSLKSEIKDSLIVKHLVFRDNCKAPIHKFLLCPLFGHTWERTDYWSEGKYPEFFCFKCYSRHIPKIVKALYDIDE